MTRAREPNTARRHTEASHPRILVLFPGALGDFLCCRPALEALRATGSLTLVARPELFDLVPPGVATVSIDRREVADLFAAGPLGTPTRVLFAGADRVESFTGWGDANFRQRLADAAGVAVSVYPFRGMAPGEHATAYYARCLRVAPLVQRFEPPPAAARWAAELWHDRRLGDRTLVVHPGSGSARKNWEGMAGLVVAWRQRTNGTVLAVLGPAEADRPLQITCDAAVRGEPLARVGALLQRASAYAGNDSGISHLAGLVGTRGVALFGPTDPHQWRPLGDTIRVVRALDPCAACGPERFCTHRLPVETVAEMLVATAILP